MSQSLPIDEFLRANKRKLFDKEFTRQLLCFKCANRRLNQRQCMINVVTWFDVKCNQCKYYKEVTK